MSALALFAAARGHAVSGSDRGFDRAPDTPLARLLREAGIRITAQDGSGITPDLDAVVFTNAVEDRHPEKLRAAGLGLPVLSRADFLAEQMAAHRRSIAVAGTSGKSTTAGLLAFVMRELGLDPAFLGGGRVGQLRSAVNPGNVLPGASDLLVAETCESDEGITRYPSRLAVVLNLSLDHQGPAETKRRFQCLADNAGEALIVNGDDPGLADLRHRSVVRFGFSAGLDFRAEKVVLDFPGSRFEVQGVPFRLRLPGRHNVLNALAAISILRLLDVPLAGLPGPFGEFRGVERRFEVHRNRDGRLVVDDYAHNPDKIAALLATVAGARRRVLYVFQPHGFGPTRLLREAYVEVFRKGLRREDLLLILPIYYSGGTVARDVSSADIVEPLRRAGKPAALAPDRLRVIEEARRFETVIIFGARDETLRELAAACAADPCRRDDGGR